MVGRKCIALTLLRNIMTAPHRTPGSVGLPDITLVTRHHSVERISNRNSNYVHMSNSASALFRADGKKALILDVQYKTTERKASPLGVTAHVGH